MTIPGLHALAIGLGIDTNAMRWMDDALCAETDPDAFFPEKGEATRPAKRICGRCEVRQECLAYALETVQEHGVWGGYSTHERQEMRREARRAA